MRNANHSYIYSNSRWTFVAHASALYCKVSEYLNSFQWFNKPLTWPFCLRICCRTEGPSVSGSTYNTWHWCRLCYLDMFQYYHRWQKFMPVYWWWRGQCVLCMYFIMLQLWVRKVCNYAIVRRQIIFVLWSLLSVMLPLHMHNFENIFVAEEIIRLQNHANCLHVQTKLCAHILSMHTDTDTSCINKNEAHTFL